MSQKKQNIQHLDKSVIYLFLVTFLISATVLAYKFTKFAPCEEVSFDVKAQQFVIGELVKFNDLTIGSQSWNWDFGDQVLSTSKEALHVYKQPGEYTVKLLVNNTCESTKTIVIEDKKVVVDSTKYPVFELPKSIKFGQTLRVEDNTPNASTWEWRFGETASANAKTKRAKYNFREPGLKTVSLIVNGDLNYITKKRIEVIPPPETKNQAIQPIIDDKPKGWNIKLKPETVGTQPEKESPKVVPYINDLEFANKIILVSQEKMSPRQFSEYFCGDVNKPVIVNGKNTTFLVFCEKIKDKKIKLKKVELFRDKGSNCIKTLTVDYKKTGLF